MSPATPQTNSGTGSEPDFPFDPTDSDSLEIRLRHKVKGEKFGFQRTAVMREFLLPEIEGYTGLMPNSIAWNAIARKYKTRYVNEVLKTYYQDQEVSLTRPVDHLADVPGHLIESRAMINDDLRWFPHAPLGDLSQSGEVLTEAPSIPGVRFGLNSVS